MLPCPMNVASHPRGYRNSFRKLTPALHPLAAQAKSRPPITGTLPYFFFAKSFPCHTSEGPGGDSHPFHPSVFWNSSYAAQPLLFSAIYAAPILQPLCFDGLPSNGRIYPSPTIKRFSQIARTASTLFSYIGMGSCVAS